MYGGTESPGKGGTPRLPAEDHNPIQADSDGNRTGTAKHGPQGRREISPPRNQDSSMTATVAR